MRTRLTQKQETFCVKYFELGNATEAAIQAGYNRKTAVVIASQNLTKLNIQTRLKELREEIKSTAIMNVQERQERLSEIARAKLTDFIELGQDGSWVNIGEETPKGGAIQEIHSRTEYDDDGSKPTIYTSVKLHDPMKAIDLLNKMDKIYSEGQTVNVDNRKVEIVVYDPETKQIVQRLLNGESPTAQINQGIQR
jgi:phage terminase small subunit